MARELAVPAELEEELIERRRPALRLLRGLRRHPLGIFGLVVIIVLVVVAILAPIIAPLSPNASSSDLLANPSIDHLFGTDRLGRDVFSRVIYGARLSLGIGLTAVMIGVGGATILGLVSGYVGGRLDDLIQRLVDVALAFPILVLLLAIVAVLGASVTNVTIAIGFALIAGTTRVIRGAVLSEKNNMYVEAARALGATDLRIMLRHVLPNIMALVIVLVSILLPAAILAEAALSFLGLGVPPGEPSWGADLSGANRESALLGFWWPVFFPGLALSLTVLGFNMLGDALRDILDPRLRGRGLS